MSETKQYLIASVGGRRPERREVPAWSAASSPATSPAGVVPEDDLPPGRVVKTLSRGHHVVRLTEPERLKLQQRPGHLVEEDHPLIKLRMPGLPQVVENVQGQRLRVTVRGRQGEPIPDVTLYALTGGVATKAETDARGCAEVVLLGRALARLIVSPRDSYWSRVLEPLDAGYTHSVEVRLRPLPLAGRVSWGHWAMGFTQVPLRGHGVRVAVVDSGIAPVADLRVSGGFDALDDQRSGQWNEDDEGHGTHCAGIVAGQGRRAGVLGGAPGADLYSLKVLPGGHTSDLIEAVTWAIDHHMDVLSMSLGSPFPSLSLQAELDRAYQAGITCLAAAGNEATRVAFPAAFPSCAAVGAIGCLGTFPDDSAHRLKVGGWFSPGGWYFAAAFSNFGPEIRYCAPGVAIPSTVPTGYASWDGTSAGCPMVAAAAAIVLDAYPELRTGNAWQVEQVRAILDCSALPLGLPAPVQGAGLPNVARALALTTPRNAARPLEFQPSWQASAQDWRSGLGIL